VAPFKVSAFFANYKLRLNEVNLGSSFALSGSGYFSFWCSGHVCILPRNEAAGNLCSLLSILVDNFDGIGFGLKKEFSGPKVL